MHNRLYWGLLLLALGLGLGLGLDRAWIASVPETEDWATPARIGKRSDPVNPFTTPPRLPAGAGHGGVTRPNAAAFPSQTTAAPSLHKTGALPCALEIERGGRSILRDCDPGAPLNRGEAGARSFLSTHAASLGLSEDLVDLQTVEVKNGIAGTRTLFAQTIDGLAVHDAYVSVNQGPDGSVETVYSTYRPLTATAPAAPSLARRAAEEAAQRAAGITDLRHPSRSELVWLAAPGSRARLTWRLLIYSDEPLGDFLTLVDDATSKVVLQENRIAFATGSGLVYQPNPIQTSGQTSLSDNNDNASVALDAERVNVTLLGLDASFDTLRGEFVDLVSLSGGLNVPDAQEPSRVYAYSRDDERFEQTVVYAVVDALQRRFHTLGFDDQSGVANGIRDFPTLAHAHWNNEDQSFYSTGDNAIHFGRGGVDDAEDGDIIVHEFGHAVQYDQNACWGGSDMGAMGEGFGDYLAASFFAGAGDATFQSAHAACVGEWDASSYSSSNPPCLRRVDGNKVYPDDLVGSVHADGEIWSAALWDIRQVLGPDITDQLVLEHHFLLPCNASMTDAGNQLIQADLDLNGGAHDAAIRTALCDRGILSGSTCIPPSALTLTQSRSPDPPVAGQDVSLTLTATNSSTGALTGVILSAAVPTGGAYIAGSASDGGSESAGTITWLAVDLGPGEQVQRSFSILLDPGGGSMALFEDDMESGSGHWTIDHDQGAEDWALDTAQPHAGSTSWYAQDPSSISDQRLTTATPITVEPGSTLSFWHAYDTESGFDGGVVESSIDAGITWTDLGGASTQNGYNDTISSTYNSPIAGRTAFTGNSAGYVETTVDLASLSGTSALIRFRMTSDSSVSGSGWRVDDVLAARIVTLASTFTASGGASSTSTSIANVQPPPPNSAPQLVNNNGLILDQGSNAPIDSTLLLVTDANAGDVLTYTVTTDPTQGTLTPTSGFTQTQIDDNQVSYEHDGSSALSDSFEFAVSDGNGGTIGASTFAITITPVNHPPVLGLSALPDAMVNSLYVVTLSPSDPDAGDSLTVFLDAAPSWLNNLSDEGGGQWSLTGIAPTSAVGSTSVTLRVRDSGSPFLEDTVTLPLVVQPSPAAVPSLGALGRLLSVAAMLMLATTLSGLRAKNQSRRAS